MSVRITGLQEVATLQNGDYIAIDNESNGTHKFDAMKMGANMASNIAPAYSTAATYAIGDFCMHDGILYKCTTAISTPESWTASHWTQTSAGVALAQKVDKVSGKGLSQNDFTNALKTKLDGIASGAEVNVQADWAQTNTSADDYIKNKPVDATASVGGLMSASDKAKLNGIAAGAEVNVQANWTETNTSSDAYIKNKPTNATTSTAGLMSASDKTKLNGIASGAEVNVQADWSQTNTSADDYIKNKPVDATSSVGGLMSATDKAKLDTIEQGAEVNVQANWSQTNTSADDYIKNKPTNATTSTAGLMSASDKTKLNGIETGAQVNVIDGVKVDGTLLTVDGNKDVDIVGKANQASLAPQYSSDTGNYVRGNYVIYQNNLYKCLQDTSGVWDATKWEQVDIGDDLEQKANIDGLYEEMTVGGAEQLISDTFNIESVPYNFRTSGGSLEIGDRETDKLIGGTVAWNQLVQNGDFADINHWLTAKCTRTASGNVLTVTCSESTGAGNCYVRQNESQTIANHVYIAMCDLFIPNTTTITKMRYGVRGLLNSVTLTQDKWETVSCISKVTTENDIFIVGNGESITQGDVFKIRNVNVIDLTAMFGTTIADYIYTLEQNTEGAGVAFFKKLFPATYYAYNAGQLMSVNAGSHVMNGFNQWDEEWENGAYYNATGLPYSDPNKIRNKNPIKVLPNTVYYCTYNGMATLSAWFFDASGTMIGTSSTAIHNRAFTTPPNTAYMNFATFNTNVTTYNNDICINIAWDGERNGEYEPYVSHTYELDDTLELRGIPKLDANNQLYYDGDVYESDGTVTRKYGIVDLGTLNWTYISDILAFTSTGLSKAKGGQNIICSKYPTSQVQSWSSLEDKTIVGNIANGYIYIKDTSYTDAASFKFAMSGVYLVYELDTPTTDSATPYTNPQIVDDWGTETYTDYSYDAQTRDVQIPVGHETRYMANLKAKLEMAPESPTGDGDYIVRQTSGENAYVAIGSSPTIQHKAEIDGTYDDMNVGGAKQLLSNVFEEDQVPYTFRTSGGSIDIGDREYDTVVGGTVAWNQLCPELNANNWSGSNTTRTYSDGVATIVPSALYGIISRSGVNSGVKVISPSHKYLMMADVKAVSDTTLAFVIGDNANFTYTKDFTATTSWAKYSSIINIASSSVANAIYYGIRSNYSADLAEYQLKNFVMFDLTAMFGTTIADYIYSLEQATAGAGVAWFKKLFPKPYYEYNAGELLSVEGVSSHDMTGFNQWDEEWERALYNASGEKVANNNYIASTNKTNVLGDTDYCITSKTTGTGVSFFICEYDGSQAFIKRSSYGAGAMVGGNVYHTEANTRFITFCLGGQTTPITTYNNDICINLHWDGERDGEYEPYVKHTYALDDSLTLRGIPKLDASNNLYYDGDTYESDGSVTRKYGIVDLGTLDWSYSSTYAFFYAFMSDRKAGSDNLLCKYPYGGYKSDSSMATATDKTIYRDASNSTAIKIKDTAYTDAATFKTAMSGVYLVYELAESTTETAEPFQNPQIVDDWGTEEYVTTSIVPVGHDTKYTANLRAKIEMAPDSPSGNGDYIMRQTDGTNSYVPLVIPNELPTMPTTDGNWVLRCTVSSGTATLSWVSAT